MKAKYIFKEILASIVWIILYEILTFVIMSILLPLIISFLTGLPVLTSILNFFNWIVGGVNVLLLTLAYSACGIIPGIITCKCFKGKRSIGAILICLLYVLINVVFAVIRIFQHQSGYGFIWYYLVLIGACVIGLEEKQR